MYVCHTTIVESLDLDVYHIWQADYIFKNYVISGSYVKVIGSKVKIVAAQCKAQ